jgi:transcriptional regulator with XRE-family HTH domain
LHLKLYGSDLRNFRKELGLTTREFASCFEIAQPMLVNIENGKLSGNEILKRMEIYCHFPEVAIFQFKINSGGLHVEKQKSA